MHFYVRKNAHSPSNRAESPQVLSFSERRIGCFERRIDSRVGALFEMTAVYEPNFFRLRGAAGLEEAVASRFHYG